MCQGKIMGLRYVEPVLLVGDHLVADMRIYKSQKPKRGDIIIFEFPKDPSKDFIKRVIGMEGEKVELVNNRIYINENLLDDPWGYFTKDYPALDAYGPVVVPKDSLFVLGDNRNNSQDSRYGGFINVKKVKGKALYLYWAKLSFPNLSKTETFKVICAHSDRCDVLALKVFH